MAKIETPPQVGGSQEARVALAERARKLGAWLQRHGDQLASNSSTQEAFDICSRTCDAADAEHAAS